ncbi:MAG: CvpA family protein [Nitrospinales bacterium]
MAIFDILLIIVVVFSLIYSIFKGMTREIFSLLSLAAGYIVAVRYKSVGADWLIQYITNETAARLISFGLLFMITAAIVSVIGWYVKKLIHSSGALSGLDRFFGAIFGVVKGVFIMVLLMFPLQLFPAVEKDVTEESVFAPHLKKLSNDLADVLDSQGEFGDSIKKKKEQFNLIETFNEKSKTIQKTVRSVQDDHSDTDQQELHTLINSIGEQGQE